MKIFSVLFFIMLFAVNCYPQAKIKNCEIFPKNNIWNTRIDSMPVHPNSDKYINTIGPAGSLRYDFGAGLWNNAPMGIPYVLVGSSVKKVNVSFDYPDESDKTDYPIPADPPIEGGKESTGDRHILIVDTSNCMLYELFAAYQNSDSSWRAGSGAVFDLNSNNLRPETWTSADAAGLPIFPGLVKYYEVMTGEINHMIRFTVPRTKREFLWPARHFASNTNEDKFPPMGLIMRLKSSFNTDVLLPQARIIATTLKKYGMILADNGSAWFMSGAPDDRWDMDDLYTLRKIKGSDFEAVDISSLRIDANSGEARQSTSSVPSANSPNGFSISPNPALDYIEINVDSRGVNPSVDGVRIFDLLGVEITTPPNLTPALSKGEGAVRLDISGLPPGLYFVRLGNLGRKFVKL